MLANNIRTFRKRLGLTQGELAERLGVNRSAIGAYEDGRAEPRLSVLRLMAQIFGCSLDALAGDGALGEADLQGRMLRVLPVAVDADNQEQLTLVPVKASAGYARGYGDVDFIKRLPHFRMPFIELSPNRTYRVFQIKGDSMLPVPPGAYIMCEYITDWREVNSDECHVVVTKDDGVVYKRVINRLQQDGFFLLKSDNPAYEPYAVLADQISEVWRAKGFVSFRLPEAGEGAGQVKHVSEVLREIREDVRDIRQRIVGD